MFRLRLPTIGVRHNSSLATSAQLVERLARTSVRAALAKTAGEVPKNDAVEDALANAIAAEADNVRWVQELLNKTEGGGYIVPEAGLLNHNIFWGDMDTFSHVNNVMYLKWFETARVNLFGIYGKRYPHFNEFMSGKGVGPIIRSCELAWRYPITFPDTITVVHKVEPLTQPDRFSLKGVVVSHNARKVAARISEIIVTVDYSNGGIKAPIPENVRSVLESRLELQKELAPAESQ